MSNAPDSPNSPEAPGVTAAYSILTDPIWYITGAFFALLTTALPAAFQQAWLLPLLQTVALWTLLLPAIRRAALRPILSMPTLWVVIQGLTFFALTLLAPNPTEVAVGNGFTYQADLLAWLYTQTPLPASLATQPLLRIIELAGILLGAVLTGGGVAIWFLARSVNLYAFGAAAVLNAGGNVGTLLGALEPWWLLRLAAFILIIALLSSPGFTGEYNPAAWPAPRRRALWWGIGLLALALLLELLLPAPWARLFGRV